MLTAAWLSGSLQVTSVLGLETMELIGAIVSIAPTRGVRSRQERVRVLISVLLAAAPGMSCMKCASRRRHVTMTRGLVGIPLVVVGILLQGSTRGSFKHHQHLLAPPGALGLDSPRVFLLLHPCSPHPRDASAKVPVLALLLLSHPLLHSVCPPSILLLTNMLHQHPKHTPTHSTLRSSVCLLDSLSIGTADGCNE
jgi:hypothetical protein